MILLMKFLQLLIHLTFFDPAHIKIYEVIQNLNNKGMIANPITLKTFLKKIIC